MTDSPEMTTTLLPCPFCGGEAVLSDGLIEGFVVSCSGPDCHANPVTAAFSKEHVAEKWNRRALVDAAPQSKFKARDVVDYATKLECALQAIAKGPYDGELAAIIAQNALDTYTEEVGAAVDAAPQAQARVEEDAQKQFVEWFCKNYPKDTIIFDPGWHAPRIYRRAIRAASAKVEELKDALLTFRNFGCPLCNGDCASANPPVLYCPMQIAEAALRAQEKA